MRIIAGKARGTALGSVEGLGTRPVLDRVKESLYSMLVARGAVEGARVLDLYAGSGSLGIEALSRGAASCVFVDSSRECADVIRANLEKAGFAGSSETLCGDCGEAAGQMLRAGRSFDLVFADPPFEEARSPEPGSALRRALEGAADMLSPGAILVLRAEKGSSLPESIGRAGAIARRRWGRSEVALYSPGEGAPEES